MAAATLLLPGLGTLVIALGYVLIKRFRRSRCQSHTACCDFESPEIKLQKENTERLDQIMELINRVNPETKLTIQDLASPDRLSKGELASEEKATTSIV